MKIIGSLGIVFAWIFFVLLTYQSNLLQQAKYELSLTEDTIGWIYLSVSLDEANGKITLQANNTIKIAELTNDTFTIGERTGPNNNYNNHFLPLVLNRLTIYENYNFGLWLGVPWKEFIKNQERDYNRES